MPLEVLDMLRRGATFHGIGYQTYLRWLVEQGLRAEARYYGWAITKPTYVTKGLTEVQQREVDRLMRVSTRRAKKS